MVCDSCHGKCSNSTQLAQDVQISSLFDRKWIKSQSRRNVYFACFFCCVCVCVSVYVCFIKVIACVVCGSAKETAIKLTDIFMHNKATNIIKRFEPFWHRFYDSSVFAFDFQVWWWSASVRLHFIALAIKFPYKLILNDERREKKTQSHKHINTYTMRTSKLSNKM